MSQGFIKTHRHIQEDPLYHSQKFTDMQALQDLHLIANFSDNFINVKGMRMLVPRGHVGWAKETLAKRWKWSRGKVDRYLIFLEKNGYIKHKNTKPIRLIHLLSYDEEQAGEASDNTTNSSNRDVKENARPYTNNNDKTDKTDKQNVGSTSKKEEALTFIQAAPMSQIQKWSADFNATIQQVEKKMVEAIKFIKSQEKITLSGDALMRDFLNREYGMRSSEEKEVIAMPENTDGLARLAEMKKQMIQSKNGTENEVDEYDALYDNPNIEPLRGQV